MKRLNYMHYKLYAQKRLKLIISYRELFLQKDCGIK